MRLLYLIFGNVFALFFVIKLLQGSRYSYLVENLDGGEFPLKSIYCVGFAWSSGKIFPLKDKMREALIGQAKLLYDPKYAEYYASIVWAQFLAFVHLFRWDFSDSQQGKVPHAF